MSYLSIRLVNGSTSLTELKLAAEEVIETELRILPGGASLPTLVSVENILRRINDAGIELASSSEVNRLAAWMTNYYIPTPSAEWRDVSLRLNAVWISAGDKPLYAEVSRVRDVVIEASRDLSRPGSAAGYQGTRGTTDRPVKVVVESVNEHPDWWRRLPRILLKTGLPLLFQAIVGVPIEILVESALEGIFKA